MAFKTAGVVGQSSFTDGAHEIKAAAGAIIFVAGDRVGGTSFETQPAVNTREKFGLLLCERRSEL